MNKFKKVMLGALSVLTLGLFVATGVVVNVYATDYVVEKTATHNSLVNDNSYTLNASKVYSEIEASVNSGEKKDSAGTIANAPTYDVFQLSSNKAWGFSNDWSNVSGIGIIAAGSGRTITIKSSGAQRITLSFEMFVTASNTNVTTYKIGSGSAVTITNGECGEGKAFSALGTVETISTTLSTDSTQNIVITMGNKHGFTSLTVTAASDDTTLSKIEISNNSTTADVGDDIPTSNNMTVTATYSNNNTADVSADSEITVKNSSNEIITGTYPSAGDYTVTASYTYKEITKTASYTVTVSPIQTFTVTYYDLDGNAQTKQVGKNKTFDVTLNPTGLVKKFVGWSKTNGGSALDDLTITEDVTLYPVYAGLVSVTKGTEKNFTSDFNSTIKDTTDWFNSDNTLYVYSSTSGITYESSSLKLGTNGSSSNNYVAFKIPANTVARVNLKLKLGGSNSTLAKVLCGETEQTIDMGNTKNDVKTRQIVVKNSTDDATMVKIYRASGSGVYIQELKVLADSMVSTFGVQYDTENPANASKIRFIATLEGIADVTTVDTVTFSITVGQVTREFKCTQLYTSISNKYSGLGAATGRYYAVYALNNIQTAIANEATFTSMSVTVTFTSESGLNPITASHAGFKLGTKGE